MPGRCDGPIEHKHIMAANALDECDPFDKVDQNDRIDHIDSSYYIQLKIERLGNSNARSNTHAHRRALEEGGW